MGKWRDNHEVLSSGCWKFCGYTDDRGYGRKWSPKLRKATWAHRAYYIEYIGDIPEGLDVDHTCFNRWCVNPNHFEAVTHRENLLRSPTNVAAISAARTHCVRGHELTGDNLLRAHAKRGSRGCKACHRECERLRRRRARV